MLRILLITVLLLTACGDTTVAPPPLLLCSAFRDSLPYVVDSTRYIEIHNHCPQQPRP